MPQDDLATQIQSARQALLAEASAVPPELSTSRPAEGEWSVAEVLSHLEDVDVFYLAQALAIRDSRDHVFQYFDDESWKARHPDYGHLRFEALRRSLTASTASVCARVSQLSEEELSRLGHHPRRGPYSVADCLRRLPAHDATHTEQIIAIRRALVAK